MHRLCYDQAGVKGRTPGRTVCLSDAGHTRFTASATYGRAGHYKQVDGRRQLCSATTGTLLLPRVRTSTGQRSFAVFGPTTWNSLPPSLCAPKCR